MKKIKILYIIVSKYLIEIDDSVIFMYNIYIEIVLGDFNEGKIKY